MILIYFKIAGKKKNWSKGRTTRHIFGREPSNDYFIKILFLLKGGMKLKKSSSLKLQSQSQPMNAEMILGWSSSKIVSSISEHRPRWPPQPRQVI
jgi:hypothetical protein